MSTPGLQGATGPQGPDGERGEKGKQGSGTARQLRSLAVLVLILLAFTGANVYWTSRISLSQEQKWCSLLITIDNSYHNDKEPPSTQLGRNLAGDFSKLRRGFDCG